MKVIVAGEGAFGVKYLEALANTAVGHLILENGTA